MSGNNFKLKKKVETDDEKYRRYKKELESQISGYQSSNRVLTEKMLQYKLTSDSDLAAGEVRDLLEAGLELRPDWDRQSEREAGRNLRDIELLGQLEILVSKVVRRRNLFKRRPDSSSKPFGGINVLLFGDWWQLKPVSGTALCVCF